MLFTLKKSIGALLLPLPALLIVMAAGIILLLFSKWQKSGKTLIVSGWLLLMLLSMQPIADRLLKPLETRWPTWQNTHPVNYVVVLGGGYTWNPHWAPSSNLLNNSLPRLTEGIRVWRANPESKMIFTGAAAKTNPVSTAEAGARVAQSLGVPRNAIVVVDRPRDTQEEAQEIAKIVGSAPFALVTSANHLPRAMAYFQREGLNPWPAPANQLAIDSPLSPWDKLVPSSLWLGHSERAVYERLGDLWQQLTADSAPSAQPRQK